MKQWLIIEIPEGKSLFMWDVAGDESHVCFSGRNTIVIDAAMPGLTEFHSEGGQFSKGALNAFLMQF